MFRILVTCVVLVACLAACDEAIAPGPSLDSLRALVTVEMHGGECPTGECRTAFRIDGDDTLHRLAPQPDAVRQLPAGTSARLAAEIARANFPLIESHPFRETCPTAYDGQETIYTFHLPAGDEVLASCRFALDLTDPLFQAVQAALEVSRG